MNKYKIVFILIDFEVLLMGSVIINFVLLIFGLGGLFLCREVRSLKK